MSYLAIILSQDEKASGIIQKSIEKHGGTAITLDPCIFENHYLEYESDFIFIDLRLQEPDGIELMHFLAKMEDMKNIILFGKVCHQILNSAKRVGESLGLMITGTLETPFEETNVSHALESIKHSHESIHVDQLAHALENNEFVLFYQPKINLKSNKVIGVEALIRWQPTDQKMIEPARFIPLAEETGLIVPITYWVINKAIEQTSQWRNENSLDLSVAINLSPKVLTNLVLPDEVSRILNQHQIPAEKICFEITESAAMEKPDAINEILTRLRIKGFMLAIDDFGTGYSSLVELQRLPFNEIKVDQSFVTRIPENEAECVITRSIIDLSHNLGVYAVAEGVETLECKKGLEDFNCDIIQGYYISPPLSAKSFLEWLYQNTDDDLTLKETQ